MSTTSFPARGRRRLLKVAGTLLVAIALLAVAIQVGKAWFVRNRLLELVSRRPERLLFTADSIEISGVATAHARGLRVRGQNRKCQWEVRLDDVTTDVDALALARKQLSFRNVRAEGVVVRIGFWPGEGVETGSAFGPPIEGLAQPPLAASARPEPRARKARPWTTRFIDARAGVREVWVGGVKYEGSAVAACDRVEVQPRHVLELDDTAFVSSSGTLTIEGVPAAQELALDVLLDILGHSPERERPREMLRHVSGCVKGTASLKDCRLERIRVKALEWVRFGGGQGRLEMDMRLDEGVFEAGSRFGLQAETLTLNALGRIVSGHADARFAVGDEGRGTSGRVELSFDDYQARVAEAPASQARFRGTGLRAALEFPEPGIVRPLADYSLEVSMPDTRFPDVRFLNDLIPKETAVRVEGGALSIGAEFKGTSAGGEGRLRLLGRNLSCRYDAATFAGELDLDAPMRLADFAGRRFEFPHAALELRGDRPGAKELKEGADRWHGTLRFPQARLDLDAPIRFDAELDAHLDDMRPVWKVADAVLGLPDILKPLVSAKDVDIRAGVRGGPGVFELRDFALDGKGLKARACVSRKGRDTAYVAWFDTGLAQGGARRSGSSKGVKPFAGPKWYDEHAAECRQP